MDLRLKVKGSRPFPLTVFPSQFIRKTHHFRRLKRLFYVNFPMLSEVGTSCVAFLTVSTFIRFFSFVDPPVPIKVKALTEALTSQDTYKVSLLCGSSDESPGQNSD